VWLDKLGLQIPTTTEELREVLRAFKTQDPNGNGVADELPLSGFANSWRTRPWPFLLNAFLYTDDTNMLNVQDGEIVAAFVQPEWREGMRYVHSLFAEGLIDEEMFTRDRSALAPLVEGEPPRLGAGTVGHRGMLGAWRGGYEGGSGDFRVVPPLRGPDGHATAGYFPFGPKTGDSAAITKDADNPEAIYKWIDFMYSREASVRNWWGVYEVDWRWAEPGEVGINGKPAVHTNLGADAVFLEPQQTQAWIHSSPFFMPSDLFGGSSGDPDEFNYEGFLIDSSHVYYEHIPEVWVPRMALDVEDAKTVSEIRPVVNDFVYESAAKFVTGRLDINDDNDWNTYLAELDKIGLPQYLEIMNATYESYK
jgi:putative aldouronate transport system substrate-binding protein